MRKRHLLTWSFLTGLIGVSFILDAGCRNSPSNNLLKTDQPDPVASTTDGAATFKPLIETAVSDLLSRHALGIQTVGGPAPEPVRICFVALENYSAEEFDDLNEQISQTIDAFIENSELYQPISKRFTDQALREASLRPDELFLPKHRMAFAATLEQEGQSADYLLYAKITSGSPRDGRRDYVLTLELVHVQTGQYNKESVVLRKMDDQPKTED